MPVELGRLTQLRDIDMSACHHAGELPWAVLARLPRHKDARFNFSGQQGGGFTNLDEVRRTYGSRDTTPRDQTDEATERERRFSASQRPPPGFVL